jgi:nickel-dependent lactate racemase
MFGDAVVDTVRVVNHDARASDTHRWMGTFGDGVPVWLNELWVDADVRITTGFVEPHFFAGFSGGPKMVAPGLAALDTVLVLHDARRIGSPLATWGVTVGNPVHDDIRAVAAACGGVTYAFDVILNTAQEVIGAFGGDLLEMHAVAIERAREVAMAPVDAPFDVVVTSGSGFPLDQNLYQSVKGMSAAAQVARTDGLIVCAAECADGWPDHGSYREVLTSASPEALLETISARERTVPDQWQVQVQARIQAAHRVVMRTSHFTDAELAEAHLEQTADVSATVAEAVGAAGPGARVCVLPEGPQTIPYVRA